MVTPYKVILIYLKCSSSSSDQTCLGGWMSAYNLHCAHIRLCYGQCGKPTDYLILSLCNLITFQSMFSEPFILKTHLYSHILSVDTTTRLDETFSDLCLALACSDMYWGKAIVIHVHPVHVSTCNYWLREGKKKMNNPILLLF
jgi:hypothetical protein